MFCFVFLIGICRMFVVDLGIAQFISIHLMFNL